MLTAEIEIRRTHRHVGTCSHLDQWEPVGKVRLTEPRVLREPSDFDGGGVYLRWVTVPAHIVDTFEPGEITRAIEDTLTSEGCHHEYDCCECLSVRARARRVSRRRWIVRESHSFNY